MLERKCIICGKIFKPYAANQRTCSKDCSQKQYRERRNEYEKIRRGETNKTMLEIQKRSDLNAAIKKANELGISYGKYKALLYMQGGK